MKNIFYLFLLAAIQLNGQQLPDYLASRDNWQLVNPAALSTRMYEHGNRYAHTLDLLVNRAFFRIEEAPLHGDAVFTWHSSDNPNYWSVAGSHDRVGGQAETNVRSSIIRQLTGYESVHLLTLGISAGFRSVTVSSDKLFFRDSNDPFDLASRESFFNPEVALGVFYARKTGVLPYFAGFSVQHLQGNWGLKKHSAAIAPARHFYGRIGLIYALVDNLELQPAIGIAYAHAAPVSLDVALRLNFRIRSGSVFWLDGGLGSAGSVTAGIGGQVNNLKLVLSYQSPAARVRRAFGPCMELMLGFGW